MASKLSQSRLLAPVALALAFGGSALAQAPGVPAEQPRVISVTGEGVIRAKPDMAVVTLGVVSDADAARDALTANTEAMTGITEALKAEGIEARDLQTSNFSIEPRYSQPPQRPEEQAGWVPEIVGYTVRNSLSVRIRDLGNTGAILDKVVTLGANSISGPSFTVAEPEKLEDSARAAAIRDAKERAETYARTAEVGLGEVLRIDETGYGTPQPYAMAPRAMKAEAFDAASVPIESGELTYTANVAVTWEIAE
jgi:uncharacterized protein